MNRLDAKVAVITGSGSGIGRATAELFAEEGAAVVIAERDESTGREAAERSNRPAGDPFSCRPMSPTSRAASGWRRRPSRLLARSTSW